MGGDGIFDPTYIELAGKTSNGDLATSVGAPTETLASAKQFVSDYAAAGFKEPVRRLRRATPSTPPTRSSTA